MRNRPSTFARNLHQQRVNPLQCGGRLRLLQPLRPPVDRQQRPQKFRRRQALQNVLHRAAKFRESRNRGQRRLLMVLRHPDLHLPMRLRS